MKNKTSEEQWRYLINYPWSSLKGYLSPSNKKAFVDYSMVLWQYKALLELEGLLGSWYEFEGQREKQALMEWCEENGVKVSD
jgi:hypothetical protein